MSIGFWQIAIVVVLVVLLFGRGKISSLMGDVAKGIKSFKKGMSDNPDQTDSISSTSESSNHHQHLNHQHLKKYQAKIKIPRKNSLQCHKLDGLRY